MARLVGTVLVLLAGLGITAAQAGFRSPESLIRNVYAAKDRFQKCFRITRLMTSAPASISCSVQAANPRNKPRPVISPVK
jgi:hypothetical protein